MTSTITQPLSQQPFLALQFHIHDVQSYVHTSVDNPTFLRGKCSHCWTCVRWCKSTFTQVGDSHLPGATPFLHLAGWTQVHQPLQSLALANDLQVW